MTQSATLDLARLWQNSLDAVMSTVTTPIRRQWLAATQPVGFSNDTIILATPHEFARHWLDRDCSDLLRDVLSEAAGRDLTVVITVQPNPEPVETSAERTSGSTPPPRSDQTDPTSTAHRGAATTPPAASSSPSAGIPAASTGPSASGSQTAPAAHDQPSDIGHPDAPAPHVLAQERAPDGIATPGETDRSDPTLPTADRPLEAPGRPPGETVSLPPPRATDSSVEPETQLNPKYVFDNFVIGASNRFAHAAAFATAEAPAKAYNPLFIYGVAGLGKTHLLHAIGHYVRSLYPRLRVRYVTTEQFTNEFISAIKTSRMHEFQRIYRQADILLVDDIQFLEGKEETQSEFFHTFNALHNAEKQIVLSSDRPPKRIERLEERLRSRFEWGLITDIQPPDLETRIAILRKKCETERLDVPAEVLEFIASKVASNIRELEGALIRVTAFASLQRAETDLSMAEGVLKDLFPDDRGQEISVQMIMEQTAEYFGLTMDDLQSKSRSRQLVTARQIAMYLVREMTDLSLPRIGKAFGGRDHTTVIHAKDKIANLMNEKRQIYDQVQDLTGRIKSHARTR